MPTDLSPEAVRALREAAAQSEAEARVAADVEDWQHHMRLAFKGIFTAAERRRQLERVVRDA